MRTPSIAATLRRWSRSKEIMAQRYWTKQPKPTKEQIEAAIRTDYAQKVALLNSRPGTAQ